MKKAINYFNNKSLKVKILIAFFIIVLCAMILLSAAMSAYFSHTFGDSDIFFAFQSVTMLNESVDSYLASTDNYIDLIFSNKDTMYFLTRDQEVDTEKIITRGKIRSIFTNITDSDKNIVSIALIKPNGEFVSNEMQISNPDYMISEEWYKWCNENPTKLLVANAGRFKMVSYLPDAGSDDVLSIAKSNGSGLIIMNVLVEQIKNTFQTVQPGRYGYGFTFLLNNSEIIYAPENDISYRIKPEWFGNGQYGSLQKYINGTLYQLVYTTSNYSGFKTVAVFPVNSGAAAMQEFTLYAVQIFLVCMVAAFLLSVLFSKKIVVDPVLKLTRLMEQAENGNLNVRFEVKAKDEIGALGNSFNHMLKKLSDSIELVQQENKSKRMAELQVLHEQIKPHFLYNTFDSIQWLARKYKATEIITVIGALTKLFRYGLNNGSNFTHVEKELAHAENYLLIQKVRYRDLISYKFNIDKSTNSYCIEKLILQPMIENAIYHGIKLKRSNGIILIKNYVKEDVLYFEIIDNGVGIPEEKVEKLNKALQNSAENTQLGYGIFNVNQRIKLNFGSSFGMKIFSRQGHYTKAIISHPVIHKEINN